MIPYWYDRLPAVSRFLKNRGEERKISKHATVTYQNSIQIVVWNQCSLFVRLPTPALLTTCSITARTSRSQSRSHASLFCVLSAWIFEEKRDCSQSTDTRERITAQGCLVPKRLSRCEEWWAHEVGREGERMRDIWQILFSRWRNVQWRVQWRMITQFWKK